MAEPKPRNWKAMREDRVLAMAENRFGKRFATKAEAIAALSGLSPREQRSLKKVAVSKAERARRSQASERMISGMSASGQRMTAKGAAAAEYRAISGTEPDSRWSASEIKRQSSVRRIEIANQRGVAAIIDGMMSKGGRASERMIAGMSASGQTPTQVIQSARAQASSYFDAARKTSSPLVATIKTRIGREAEARAIGAEMHIASRVAKAQLTRAAAKETSMATIPERLKGLKKDQLQAVAREVGVLVKGKTTVATLRAEIQKRVVEHARFEGKNSVAAQSRPWGGPDLDRGAVNSATAKGRSAMEARINAAIDKVAADAPAKAHRAPRAPVNAITAEAIVEKYGAARASKTNPGLVEDLSAKVNAALSSGDAGKLQATLAEVKSAKLSKADSHALAKSLGLPVASSTTGKAAVERVTKRLANQSGFLQKIKAVGGRSAASILLPFAAAVAATAAFNDKASAAEARGEDRTHARAAGSTAAAKEITDVVTFGAGSAVEAALAAGKSRGEALLIGAAKAGVNYATMGVVEAANDALASQGGFAGYIDKAVKMAGEVLFGGKAEAAEAPKGNGKPAGWSDAAREASAEARGVAKPGEAKADTAPIGRGAEGTPVDRVAQGVGGVGGMVLGKAILNEARGSGMGIVGLGARGVGAAAIALGGVMVADAVFGGKADAAEAKATPAAAGGPGAGIGTAAAVTAAGAGAVTGSVIGLEALRKSGTLAKGGLVTNSKAGALVLAGALGIGAAKAGIEMIKASAGGLAFLNPEAEKKAQQPEKAPVSHVVAHSANAERRSDGETNAYTRRGRNGQTVRVKAYRTPNRR